MDLGIWEGDGWVWGDSRFCAVRSGSRQRLALQLKRLPTATPEVTQDRCSLIWREPLPCRLPMESGARCSPWETCGESRYPPPPSPQAQWRRNRAPCAAHPGVPIPEGSDLASVRSQTPTSPLAMSGCLASPSGPLDCAHTSTNLVNVLSNYCIPGVLVSYCHCTKLPQLRDSKQYTFIIPQFWRSEVWRFCGAKIDMSGGCIPSGSSRRGSLSSS